MVRCRYVHRNGNDTFMKKNIFELDVQTKSSIHEVEVVPYVALCNGESPAAPVISCYVSM